MENLRLTARKSIQAGNLNESVLLDQDGNHGSQLVSLHALWTDVSAHINQDAYGSVVCLIIFTRHIEIFNYTNLLCQVNENLLVIRCVLKNHLQETPLKEEDKNSAEAIYTWLTQLSLPSSKFAASLEASYSANSKI